MIVVVNAVVYDKLRSMRDDLNSKEMVVNKWARTEKGGRLYPPLDCGLTKAELMQDKGEVIYRP